MCERFTRKNGLCIRTKTTIAQKQLRLYEESDASSENNHEDDFCGSDDNFLGFND
jgi:hypothetical protein